MVATAGLSIGEGAVQAAKGQHGEAWVLYALPRTRITMRWQLLRAEGGELVIKVETYIEGELRAAKEMKRPRLRVPEQYRRETIRAGVKNYDCKVFRVGTTTYWYSDDVPLLGIVRSETADGDILELVEAPEWRLR